MAFIVHQRPLPPRGRETPIADTWQVEGEILSNPLVMPQSLNRVDPAGAPRGHESRARGHRRQSDGHDRRRAQVGGHDAEEL